MELNPKELYHLAIKASSESDREKSIVLLKRFLQTKEGDTHEISHAHYLLGAEYADIRMFEEGLSQMRKAVDINPSLDAAHFQIGLIMSLTGKTEDAEKAWQPIIQKKDETLDLYLFVQGLAALNNNQPDQAVMLIEKGLDQHTTNPPLRQDMIKLRDKVKNKLAGAGSKQEDTHSDSPSFPQESERSLNKQHLLNRYSEKKH